MAQDINASELLARFARDRDESAFAELVNRYAGLVHAAALRRADGRHGLAEDAAQLVFLELARHAARLRPDTQLGGWLHRCTLSITSDLMKSERRRAAREDRAGTEQDAGPARAEDTLWGQTAPLIDEILQSLGPQDRDAVTLRFFEGHSFQAIGERLGTTEDTAHKRVSRALDKMRAALRRRGIVSTASLLAGFLSAHASPPPPPGLAAQIVSLAAGSFEALPPPSLSPLSASASHTLPTAMKLTRRFFPAATVLTAAILSPLLYWKLTPATDGQQSPGSADRSAPRQDGRASASARSAPGTLPGVSTRDNAAVSTTAAGALSPEEAKRAETRRTAETRAQERSQQGYEEVMELLKTKFNLTPEQENALAQYHQGQREKWIRYMVGATLREADPSLYQLEAGYREKIPADLQPLLTPEQLADYQEWDQRRRTNHVEAITTGELGYLADRLDLSTDQKDRLFASLSGINSTALFEDLTGIRTLGEIAAQADQDVSRRREAFAKDLNESQMKEWEKVVTGYKKQLLQRFGGKEEGIASSPSTTSATRQG